jgi:nucleotide-binding universal stress UspA family protein
MGTIVCAVDDSREAEEALCAALRLSRDAGLRLVVVHVEQGTTVTGAAEQRGRHLLDQLLARQGLNELARVAAEEAASMIVLGSRSRRWWRRRRASRLTSDLAATAACPVVVVPPARER